MSRTALWGPLLDRLNVVGVADRRALRPIGPGGYTDRECYRTLVEVLLAGGDFLARRGRLAGGGRAGVGVVTRRTIPSPLPGR